MWVLPLKICTSTHKKIFGENGHVHFLKTRNCSQEAWLLTSEDDELDGKEERREDTTSAIPSWVTVHETPKSQEISGASQFQRESLTNLSVSFILMCSLFLVLFYTLPTS